MGKQTKRARKFVSSGGVKARLQKGTITNKGKFTRGRKRGSASGSNNETPKKQARTSSYSAELEQKRRDEDILSDKNLGDLEIESFFSTIADGLEDDNTSVDDNENEEMMEDSSDDDDDDDDDDEVKKKGVKRKKKAKEEEDESSEAESSDASSEDVQAKRTDTKTKKSSEKAAKKEKSSSTKKDIDKKSSDESGSDSEESDIEAAERIMKQEMGRLKTKDPEFHEFLKENEESLLDYGIDDEESGNEDDSGKDLKPTKLEKLEKEDSDSMLLTPKMLKKLEQGTFKSHGIKSLKKLVNAYKSACHSTDEAQDKDDKKGKKYIIESPAVFDRLMLVSLNRCHEEFHYHLLGKGSNENNSKKKDRSKKPNETTMEANAEEDEEEFDPNKPISPKVLEKSPRWSDMKPILYTFLKSTIHVLSEAKDPDLVALVLKALSRFVPYMTPFERLAEVMLKTLTGLWSAPIDSSEDYQVVRLHSFFRIRQLALTQPFPFIEESLKKSYLAYAQRAKFATAASVTSALPTLTFMGNCVVELYSLDYHSSYQHAFVYIRQLALHLRTAMQKKTQEAFGAVYCWQYIHCLKLWVAVLTEACQSNDLDGPSGGDELMRSLLFPLAQVILGTVRLIPSTRYLPLRLHCVRLLQQLAAAAHMFLPTTSILLDVFDMREVSLSPKKSDKGNSHPLALTLKLRADNPLRTMDELEMCISDVFVLLNREVNLYQYSAGFPEFSVRISLRLRKFIKQTRQHRWRAYAKGCLELCERYSQKAMEARAKLKDLAPKDVKQLEILRPVNEPDMNERHKTSLEKEKRLEAASRPIQKPKTSAGKNETTQDEEPRSKKRAKKAKKKAANNRSVKENLDALEEEDEVQEGIDWSDDE